MADMMIAAVADRNAAIVLIGADHAPRTGTASAQHDLRGHVSTSRSRGCHIPARQRVGGRGVLVAWHVARAVR